MRQKPAATCGNCDGPITGLSWRGMCQRCYRAWLLAGNRATPLAQLSKSRQSQGRRPAESTPFEPGTDGKKEVMRLRAGRGESCFHPDDAKGGDNHKHAGCDDDDD